MGKGWRGDDDRHPARGRFALTCEGAPPAEDSDRTFVRVAEVLALKCEDARLVGNSWLTRLYSVWRS